MNHNKDHDKDFDKVRFGLDLAISSGEEIDDQTARVIAAHFSDGSKPAAAAFVDTGAISDPSAVWRELLLPDWPHAGDYDYRTLHGTWKHAADYLGTYLHAKGPCGPQDGWNEPT